MDKIKVLQAIRQGRFGGGETHVYDLSLNLNKNLFEPIVLSFTDGDMVRKLIDQNVQVHIINSKYPFDFRTLRKVKKLLRNENIEIVHAHGTRAASNLVMPAKNKNLPLIYTVHGWSFNENQKWPIRKARIAAEKWITSQTHENICVGESNLDYGKKNIHQLSAKVVPNGISLDKFNYGLKSDFNLDRSGNEIWIGLIARICYQKDPITLLKAFKKSLTYNGSLRLLLVGEGDMKSEVESYIESNSLTNFVRLEPFRRDIPEILKAIDIYCLPSLWEGLPIGLLEAMAMKKCCIASKVDGNIEVLSGGIGHLVPKQNVTALSEAIIQLANDEKTRTTMGELAYTKVKKLYSLDSMIKSIESIYSNLRNSNNLTSIYQHL